MKLNKIFIFATVAAASLFAVSCNDDNNDSEYSGPGQWDAQAGFAQLYFQETSKTESIDPADPTTYTFEVFRRVEHEYTYAKDSEGNDSLVNDVITTALPALTAKPTLIANTDSVFTVSDVTFAEGDTVATVTLNFPNTEIGKQYTAQVKFDDPALTSLYSADITYTYKVTRVKWNLLGKGKFYDYFVGIEGECEIYQRDDAKSNFRVMNPYKDIVPAWVAAGYEATSDPADMPSEYIDFRILSKGEVVDGVTIEDENIVYWGPYFSSGMIHPSYTPDGIIYHLMAYNWSSRRTYDYYQYNRVLDYLEDGKTPGQVQLATAPYMWNYGGWSSYLQPAVKEDAILITFPGYVEEYTATLDDYDWVPLYKGMFNSGKLGTKKSGVALYKGVAKAELEAEQPGCYERDSLANGVPYYIENPYEEGSTLVFYANGDKIIVPEDYELQETGITAMGDNVFAKINAGKSRFESEEMIVLNITFQTEPDNDGNFIEYGTTDEIMANLTYSVVGTGVYTYGVEPLSQNGGSAYEGTENATLYQCNQMPDSYYLAPWANSEEGLNFTIGKDGYIRFYQFTGDTYPNYGDIYFMDLEAYNPTYTSYLGTYDAETKTYTFSGSYYIPDAGAGFGLISETFVLNADAAAARSTMKKNLRFNYQYKATPRFVGTKAQKVSRLQQKFGTVPIK